MIHIFQQGSDPSAPTFLMLHGTGGTERDLIPLAKKLQPHASVLSVRGSVIEHGKACFFRQSKAGEFDQSDLIFRTEELNRFLSKAAETYNFDQKKVVALGISNGANIAANLLLSYADALIGAILYHPMVPQREIGLPDLTGTSIFIGAGKNNELCSPEEATELNRLLKQAHADVTLHWENCRHYLTGELFAASKAWYESKYLT